MVGLVPFRWIWESSSWRASVASETLTGVKMKKSGMFVYLLASERSERDSIRGG